VTRTSPIEHILEENKKERERNSRYESASEIYLKTGREKQIPAEQTFDKADWPVFVKTAQPSGS
jgi:hypothetical protein